MVHGRPLYWRETHRQVRFGPLDGRVVVLFLMTILHLRLWTLSLTLACLGILFFFSRKGIHADSILRYLRASIVGRKRSAHGLAAERMPVDYGFETEALVRQHADRLAAEDARRMKAREAP
jgi:hypothetical protein